MYLAILIAAAAAPAEAQQPRQGDRAPATLALTIAAGGAAFSDFQRATEQPDGTGARFERRLSAGTSAAVGADLLWWPAGTFGLRGHVSYMPSRFSVKYDRAGEEWLRRRSGTPEAPDYAGLDVWAADVSLLVRPSLTLGRVAPYVILGGGAVSYRPRSEGELPPEAARAFDGPRTELAGVAGIGALVPLQRGRTLLSFTLTDHVTRTPVGAGAAARGERDPQNLSSLLPTDPGEGVRLTSNVRLLVGLTIPLNPR